MLSGRARNVESHFGGLGGLFGASGVTVRDVYFDTSVFPPVEDVGVSFGDAERAEVCEVAEGCEDVRRAGAFEERADGVRVETGWVKYVSDG